MNPGGVRRKKEEEREIGSRERQAWPFWRMMEAPVTSGKRTMMSLNKIRWRKRRRKKGQEGVRGQGRTWKTRKCTIACDRERKDFFCF